VTATLAAREAGIATRSRALLSGAAVLDALLTAADPPRPG
jgi:hypothetical protein